MIPPWRSPIFWAFSLTVTGITGLLAGSYPAFYLSGFRPVRVLKGAFKTGKGASLPRKILVVAQFSISLSLIIGTLVVFGQIQYAMDRPVGYDRAGLINIPVNTDALDRHYDAFRTSLFNTGVVAGVANASTQLTAYYQNNFMEWPGMTEEQRNISFRGIAVHADFGPTIGLDGASGPGLLAGLSNGQYSRDRQRGRRSRPWIKEPDRQNLSIREQELYDHRGDEGHDLQQPLRQGPTRGLSGSRWPRP